MRTPRIRQLKVVLVWAIALLSTLEMYINLTYYDDSFGFLAHVLRWETVDRAQEGMWGPINALICNLTFYWFFYTYRFIFVVAAAAAVLSWWGGLRLFLARNDPARLHQTKGIAVAGLTLGIVMRISGFITYGAIWSPAPLWFGFWQIGPLSGLLAALVLTLIIGVTLPFLVRRDREKDARKIALVAYRAQA